MVNLKESALSVTGVVVAISWQTMVTGILVAIVDTRYSKKKKKNNTHSLLSIS
jgi:hypothetical protein